MRVCADQRGRDFEAVALEWGIHFRGVFARVGYNISNARKLQFCKQPFEIIQFNAFTSKLLYSCCTLERSIKNWPISRTGYQF